MTALVILAAGESSRMGLPKQNLLFQNKTLLERAIETGLSSNCEPVIVVLGANADQINTSIKYDDIKIINNTGWAEGMASSIRIAVSGIVKDASINSAIFMLCDQPFVTKELIENMQQKHIETGKPIIASSYQHIVGVPALFGRSMFERLSALAGHEGAKKIIIDHQGQVATIPFELGNIDIDTRKDYERLIRNF